MNFFSGNDLIFAKSLRQICVKSFKNKGLFNSSKTETIHRISSLAEKEEERKLIWVVVSPEEFQSIHGAEAIQDWARAQAAYISLASRVPSLPLVLDECRKDPVLALQQIGSFLDVEADISTLSSLLPPPPSMMRVALPANVILLARMAGLYENY